MSEHVHDAAMSMYPAHGLGKLSYPYFQDMMVVTSFGHCFCNADTSGSAPPIIRTKYLPRRTTVVPPIRVTADTAYATPPHPHIGATCGCT